MRNTAGSAKAARSIPLKTNSSAFNGEMLHSLTTIMTSSVRLDVTTVFSQDCGVHSVRAINGKVLQSIETRDHITALV